MEPTGTEEQPGTGSSCFLSVLRADLMPQCSIAKHCLERAGHLGVLTGLWAQARPPLQLWGTHPENSRHRNQWTAWDRILLVSIWALSWPCATALYTQILERAGRTLTHLWVKVRSPLLLKVLAQEGPAWGHQDTGTKERLGTGSFQFLSVSWSWPCATAHHIQIPLRENWSHRSTDTLACRSDKPQSETARPANTRDNQIAKGKGKNISTRIQGMSRTLLSHHSEPR